jgi:hypothetical protein
MFKLLGFLADDEVCESARRLFSRFGDCLREIAAHADNSSKPLQDQIANGRHLRDELRKLLHGSCHAQSAIAWVALSCRVSPRLWKLDQDRGLQSVSASQGRFQRTNTS